MRGGKGRGEGEKEREGRREHKILSKKSTKI